VGVRRLLPLFVRTRWAHVFHHRGVIPQPAIRQNRKNGTRPRAVVGNKEVLAGFVERQNNTGPRLRRNLIQKREFPALHIHRESAHGASLARFVRRIQNFPPGCTATHDGSRVSAATPFGVSFPVSASNSTRKFLYSPFGRVRPDENEILADLQWADRLIHWQPRKRAEQ